MKDHHTTWLMVMMRIVVKLDEVAALVKEPPCANHTQPSLFITFNPSMEFQKLNVGVLIVGTIL